MGFQSLLPLALVFVSASALPQRGEPTKLAEPESRPAAVPADERFAELEGLEECEEVCEGLEGGSVEATIGGGPRVSPCGQLCACEAEDFDF
jgi:hypothetical protein